MEVPPGPEHARALVVDVEKTLQIGEFVGGADVRDVFQAQLQLVSPGEREHQLGLERALDMKVELRLGQRGAERVQG